MAIVEVGCGLPLAWFKVSTEYQVDVPPYEQGVPVTGSERPVRMHSSGYIIKVCTIPMPGSIAVIMFYHDKGSKCARPNKAK